jgi:tRNA(fMet)-specific endonuclease VapC
VTARYLLDTCVLSDIMSKKPNPAVLDWIGAQVEETLFLSVITIGEIQNGIVKLSASKRKARLELWLKQDLLQRFGTRVLPLDAETLITWGTLTAMLAKRGRVLPVMDSLLAATALHHKLTLVTRNTADFAGTDIRLLNVWER